MRFAVERRSIVAALALAAAPAFAASAADLEVTAATPRGVLDDAAARIQVVFDRPVATLGAPEPGVVPPEWLRIEPPILARWRWAGTRTLIGEPAAALPMATTWRLTVTAACRGLDGSTLRAPFAFTFSTPPPRPVFLLDRPEMGDPLELATQIRGGWSGPGLDTAPSSAVLIAFDQPVDAGSLASRLSVRVEPRPFRGAKGAAPGPAAFDLTPDEKEPRKLFRIRPRGDWPGSAKLLVRLAEGVRGLEGPDPGPGAAAEFATPWPLAPIGFEGQRSSVSRAYDPSRVALRFSVPVRWKEAREFVHWREAGSESWSRPVLDPESWRYDYPSELLDLSVAELRGGKRYEVCVDPGLEDVFGRKLESAWCDVFRAAHARPHFRIVEGNGVLEWHGPHRIPLSSLNVSGYRVEHRRLSEEDLVAALRGVETWRERNVALGESVQVRLNAAAGTWAISPVDLDPVLGGRPGLVLSRLQVSAVVPDSEYEADDAEHLRRMREAITQVTSLGLTVKNSRRDGVLVWVTRLREAEPAPGAEVVVRDKEGLVLWRGTTDAAGLAQAPALEAGGEPYLVTARIGEDLAYARTNWHEGHRGYDFNLPVDWNGPRRDTGLIWFDRGIARPGESIRLKFALRSRSDRELRVDEGREVVLVVRNARDEDILVKTFRTDPWGAAETEIAVPPGAPLGAWTAMVSDRYDEKARFEIEPIATGGFRVAEFRRPKFRVRATPERERLVAGDAFAATVEGALLSGGAMSGARARWSIRSTPSWWRPKDTRWDGWDFLDAGFEDESERGPRTEVLGQGEADLDAAGAARVTLPRVEGRGALPARIEIEGEVEDADRQRSASIGTVDVIPGEFFVGLRRGPYFVKAGERYAAQVVALSPDGGPIPGRTVTLTLERRRWDSVRHRDTAGRYVFESRPVVESVAERAVVTGDGPADVRFEVAEPGEYAVVARATDDRGNAVAARTAFYVTGPGFTPWRRDQENRIDLVVEKSEYAPGETARILVKSPWERALALVTVERSGVMERRLETLAGTTPVLEIPVRDEHAPNVFVSVVMLRGRVDAPSDPEMTDPGRPAYRIGCVELTIPPTGRKLAVRVSPDRESYRPADRATVEVAVATQGGGPRRASVTVWAVDAGVLALTGYRTPDLLGTFYARQGLGISTSESRSRLVGRRSYGTKADRTGGGGGFDPGERGVRRDFRALAVWRGDVVTGDDGRATLSFVLPDSLTTYRLMAVAMAGADAFGSADADFRVTKPVGIEAALPRFLRPADAASAGVVVRNRTEAPRDVEVRARVVAGPVTIAGAASLTVSVPAGGSAEVPFALTASAPGSAKLRFDAVSSRPAPERDAIEIELPVVAIAPSETVATFFAVEGAASETVRVPADAFPETGGLEVRLASTTLLPAREGVRFLVDYPHACAEQVASQVLGVVAAMRLGEGFAPDTVGARSRDDWMLGALERLASCQTSDGGFGYWPGSARSVAAVSAHAAWALAEAERAGLAVDRRVLDRAAAYLSAALRIDAWPFGERDGWTPKVLACLALARLGRAEPAYFQALFDRREDGRPAWAKAALAESMFSANPSDPRGAILLDEIGSAIRMEARTARLEAPRPDWDWWFFGGEPRDSAAVLGALLARGADGEMADRFARGLLDHLGRDRSPTTHDTAWMLQALARYRESREAGAGRRTAEVRVGGKLVLRSEFEGTAPKQDAATMRMPELGKRAAKAPERALRVDVETEGRGLVQVAATLTYAPRGARPPSSRGISVARRFLTPSGRPVTGVEAGEELVVEIVVEADAVRRFVAVEAPLPAGIEALDPGLATFSGGEDELEWVPGFDHVELRDDRISLYATELPAGRHVHRVRCRATTAGTFAAAPARAEEMYAPEIFGTTSGESFRVDARP